MDCNTIYVSSATTSETDVVLTPNREIKNIDNCGTYKLIICCNATATSNLPVSIVVNGNNIPVLCKAGNEVYSSQLEKRRCYTIMFGNENTNYTNGQFVIQNRINPKSVI